MLRATLLKTRLFPGSAYPVTDKGSVLLAHYRTTGTSITVQPPSFPGLSFPQVLTPNTKPCINITSREPNIRQALLLLTSSSLLTPVNLHILVNDIAMSIIVEAVEVVPPLLLDHPQALTEIFLATLN